MEIGSEFWKNKKQYFNDNVSFCLSGRTALDAIVKDATKTFDIKSALLPSYCCHTMIEPFVKNGIAVRFYDVYVNEYDVLTADIPAPYKNEIFYIMKYFGDTDISYTGDGKDSSGWTVTVEDLTHSCFCTGYESKADYCFASYRKWFAVDGIAAVWSKHSRLANMFNREFEEYCSIRNDAFEQKTRYMAGEPIAKETYLDTFAKAEDLLSEHYEGCIARPDSIGNLYSFIDTIKDVAQTRRSNAYTLQQGLSDIDGIKCFVNFNNEAKCPLFVPILVEPALRDKLRSYLIQHEIYCPVHWPLSQYHSVISSRAKEVYDSELSLVCDQRYTKTDMALVIETITLFRKGNFTNA